MALYQRVAREVDADQVATEYQQRLIEANYHLIYGYIKKQKLKHPLTVEDYIDVGHIVLMRAARGWDPRLATLSTYVYRAMNQEIYRLWKEKCKDVSRFKVVTDHATDDNYSTLDQLGNIPADHGPAEGRGEIWTQAMSHLTPSERKLITDLFYRGRSICNLAREQNRSKQAVSAEKYKILERLREKMADLEYA